MAQGKGIFVRSDVTRLLEIRGRYTAEASVAVALRPGWNQIANPLQQTVQLANVEVVHAADLPSAFVDAIGTLIGGAFFAFERGAPDPVTGAPETGTFVEATSFEPGRSYFVKVFSAEGVSMLFHPDSARSRQGGQRGGNRRGWQIKLNLGSAAAYVGQAEGALESFSPMEDSELPPGLGGVQIAVGEALYRDLRPFGKAQDYKLTVSGLQPGKRYTLRLSAAEGRPLRAIVFDKGRKRGVRVPGAYHFVANDRTRTITIRAGGRR
jgi:hypothetical protein